MAVLDPRGLPVEERGVVVTSPGFSGSFTVQDPYLPGTRSLAAGVGEPLTGALAELGFEEQLSLEIEPEPTALEGAATRSVEAERPRLDLQVPAPGEAFGQLILMVDDATGALSWHFAAHLESGIAGGGADRRGVTRGAEERVTYRLDGTLDVAPGALPGSGAPGDGGPRGGAGTRGLAGTLGRKILKVLVFRLLDKAAGRVADFFVHRWEAHHRPHRLRSFTADDHGLPGGEPLAANRLAAWAGSPALLFLHGTLSRADRAFGSLPAAVVGDLHRHYGERVFAFDHPTASVTPADNAAELLRQLPSGAGLELDVIAHSRGGLVARELVERPKSLELDPATLRLRRVVFVATPNRGTAFCNVGYLGFLLDVLTNLVGVVQGNPVLDLLEVITAVAKQLAVGALGGLEGLTAMDPQGPYLARLNQASGRAAVYTAAASDFEPRPGMTVARRLRDRFTDALFRGAPNDLVVPTEGVYGANGASGFPIPASETLLFPGPDGVDHSGFWERPRLHQALLRWLPG